MRFFTAGESHGPCLTAIIEGLPAGLVIDLEAVNRDLARRQQGYGRGGRMKIEKDTAEVLSGIRFGQTLGSPVTLAVRNRDWVNWGEGRMSQFGEPQGPQVVEARPGHADLTGILKYDRADIRDILERASARETAARVAVGGIAKQLLAAFGIQISSHVTNIGGVTITGPVDYSRLSELTAASELNCIEPEAEQAMKAAIDQAKKQGDTLGGTFEIVATQVMPGLGSHVQWDRRLDTKLAALLMSIPAIKGVEFGAGFQYANLPGSQAHDEIYYDEQRGYYRQTNRAGGLEGGMSNGEPIVARVVMKPIPTLMKPLNTVDVHTKQPVKASTERSDVCAVSAASVVGEAMLAIGLAQTLLEQFSRDNMTDLQAAVKQYLVRAGMHA